MHWFPVNSDDPPADSRRRPQQSNSADADILDAYSAAVVSVVDSVSPAVISVRGREGDRGGSGSGFIITADGYAVTNSHVAAERRRLVVETDDGDKVDAEVVGDDPATDIALLRLAARDLPYVAVGDSSALRVGQLVIALGSPLGLQSTVSTGVVSATGRSMRSQAGRLIESVVQHSAPINPGNSGGPLVDSRGRVVGVNTAIIMMAQGIGFAVSSNTAQWVAGEILAHGGVRRRQLGVVAEGVRLSRKAMRDLDWLTDQAVLVRDVQPGGPAARSGLQAGDILLSMNERIVESVDDVHRLLSVFPVDLAIELAVARGSQRQLLLLH